MRIRFAQVVDAITLPGNMSFVTREPDAWTLRVEGELGALFPLLGTRPVRDVEIAEPSLEDVLRGFYREGSA